jgi:hypothetical protein
VNAELVALRSLCCTIILIRAVTMSTVLEARRLSKTWMHETIDGFLMCSLRVSYHESDKRCSLYDRFAFRSAEQVVMDMNRKKY